MKTFKEFQTESYSRLDEGLRNMIGKGLMWTGVGGAYDVLKPSDRKGNQSLRTALQVGATWPQTTMNVTKKILDVGAAGAKALWSLGKIKG